MVTPTELTSPPPSTSLPFFCAGVRKLSSRIDGNLLRVAVPRSSPTRPVGFRIQFGKYGPKPNRIPIRFLACLSLGFGVNLSKFYFKFYKNKIIDRFSWHCRVGPLFRAIVNNLLYMGRLSVGRVTNPAEKFDPKSVYGVHSPWAHSVSINPDSADGPLSGGAPSLSLSLTLWRRVFILSSSSRNTAAVRRQWFSERNFRRRRRRGSLIICALKKIHC